MARCRGSLRTRVGIGVALALALGGVTPAAGAETDGRRAWDPATVTALAAELADATRALKTALRRETAIVDAARHGQRDAVGLFEAVDGLDKSARRLSRRLAGGAGYEETLPIARKMRSQVRDAERFGAHFLTTAWLHEKVDPVRDRLERLAPYYFGSEDAGDDAPADARP